MDDYRRLREDVLPAVRMVKDAQQPLPNLSNGPAYESTLSPPAPTPSTAQSAVGLKRQYSTKEIMLGTTAKATSPTHLQTNHDRSIVEQTLDPSSAAERAVLSSSHLAAMNGSGGSASSPSYPSPNMPSPTSPPTGMLSGTTLGARSYRAGGEPTPSSRSTFAPDDSYNQAKNTAPRRMQTPAPETPGAASNASVEIFKSFRVSMDDPCYKVLPAALKKYQINAPWDQYALYIVYGDQERCLALDEKPLILFKQLDKEGKKPMFMLRKTNNASADGAAAPDGTPGSAGLVGPGSSTAAAAAAAARGVGGAGVGYDPPGGII